VFVALTTDKSIAPAGTLYQVQWASCGCVSHSASLSEYIPSGDIPQGHCPGESNWVTCCSGPGGGCSNPVLTVGPGDAGLRAVCPPGRSNSLDQVDGPGRVLAVGFSHVSLSHVSLSHVSQAKCWDFSPLSIAEIWYISHFLPDILADGRRFVEPGPTVPPAAVYCSSQSYAEFSRCCRCVDGPGLGLGSRWITSVVHAFKLAPGGAGRVVSWW